MFKPRLRLDEISGLRASSLSGIIVRTRSGQTMRISSELPSFQDLLDLLCDRIAANGHTPDEGFWRAGPHTVSVSARNISVATEKEMLDLDWSRVRELWIGQHQLRLVSSLHLDNDDVLLVPHVGYANNLAVYQVLRKLMLERVLPMPTPALRTERERERQSQARRTVIQILVSTSITVGVSGLLRACAQKKR